MARRVSEFVLEVYRLIPFEELKQCYIDNEIGIIASYKNQCSYVALGNDDVWTRRRHYECGRVR